MSESPEAAKSEEGEAFRFAKDDPADGTNLADDERLALFAVCIAHQQNAGFKTYIDARQVECPECNSPGFNTGWGYWAFTCGGELLSDGTCWSEPCGRTPESV
jgi:hypothetical protein